MSKTDAAFWKRACQLSNKLLDDLLEAIGDMEAEGLIEDYPYEPNDNKERLVTKENYRNALRLARGQDGKE